MISVASRRDMPCGETPWHLNSRETLLLNERDSDMMEMMTNGCCEYHDNHTLSRSRRRTIRETSFPKMFFLRVITYSHRVLNGHGHQPHKVKIAV